MCRNCKRNNIISNNVIITHQNLNFEKLSTIVF